MVLVSRRTVLIVALSRCFARQYFTSNPHNVIRIINSLPQLQYQLTFVPWTLCASRPRHVMQVAWAHVRHLTRELMGAGVCISLAGDSGNEAYLC
jgi:hypothetical protein